jgi:polyisoprenoid-binding protein YceI
MRNRLATAACLAVLGVGSAQPAEFGIPSGEGSTRVRFDSRASLESFHGETNLVSGQVIFDPDGVADSVRVYVEVDMASLDTGIGKRNKDMRENHLETDRFPVASFAGARLIERPATRLLPGETYEFLIEGRFTLHGVTRERQLPVRVTLEEREGRRTLHVVSTFKVLLADHGISRPRFLFLRLAEDQTVTFDVVAVARP